MNQHIKTLREALAVLVDIGENDMYAEEWKKAQQALTALDALEAAMREPVAWRTFDGEGGYDYRCFEGNEDYIYQYVERNGGKYADWVQPLFAAPPAQQTQAEAVPQDVLKDAQRYRWLRNEVQGWYVGPSYATYNDVVCEGEYCDLSAGGVALDSAIDAAIAAAPQPKEKQ